MTIILPSTWSVFAFLNVLSLGVYLVLVRLIPSFEPLERGVGWVRGGKVGFTNGELGEVMSCSF